MGFFGALEKENNFFFFTSVFSKTHFIFFSSFFPFSNHHQSPTTNQPTNQQQDPNDKTSCSPADAGGVDILRAGMAACFKHAVEKGLSISIAPHLDDGLGLGGWRNGLVFDPLARYGSFSYAEFMLYPLADALNAAIGPNTKVSFALQGEMSATVFYYPKSYLTLIPYIKNRVLAGEKKKRRDGWMGGEEGSLCL